MSKKRPIFAHAMCPVALWLLLFPTFGAAQDKPAATVFVQLGHSAAINATAFSPDGQLLASGSDDKTIKLWEVSSGREIKTLTGHDGYVVALAFLKDGKSLASIGSIYDQSIRIWDIATGKETFRYKMKFLPSFSVGIAGFSPDAKYAVVGDRSHGDRKAAIIKVIETATGQEVRDFSAVKGEGKDDIFPEKEIFSPDGKKILLVFSKSMRLLDIASGNEIRTFPISYSYGGNQSAAFSADGKLVVVGTHNTLGVFDITTGQTVVRFEQAHPGEFISHVAFSADGKYAVTASAGQDGAIKLWDVQGKKEARAFAGHGPWVNSLTFAPSGAYFISGGSDKTVKLWDIRSGAEVRRFSGATNVARSGDVSPDGRYALSASGREIILWDMVAGKRERVFRGHADTVTAVTFSPDGRFVFSGGYDNTARLWEIATGKEIRKFTSHTDDVYAVAFSPDGRFVLSGGGDNTARLWDVATAREIRRFHNSILVEEKDLSGKKVTVNKGGGFHFLGFSKDGRTAVLSRLDLTDVYSGTKIHYDVYDASTWQKQRTFLGTGSGVALSPDGNYLLAGRQLIEVSTGNTRREYDFRPFGVKAFSPDTNYFVFFDETRQAGIVEISSDKLVKLEGPTHDITSVIFTPNGKNVLSSGGDGTIRVWDTGTGKEIAQMIHFNDGEWIAMTPQGYYDASEKGDQHVNVRIGNHVYGVDQYREKFYRPEVVLAALAGKPITDLASLTSVKPAPSVSIVDTPLSVSSDEVTVKVKVTDAGGGVGDVRLYLNGSSVVFDRTRDLAVAAKPQGPSQVFSYRVRLVSGTNSIRAIAFNTENSMQSTDALHEIEAGIPAKKPSLHALLIGIQEYDNPKLTLKYPVADARLMASTLKERATGLFEGVNVVELTTKAQTTKEAIIKTLKEMSGRVRPDDLFVFFVASHGTVDDGEYFLITSNVGATSTHILKQTALSQDDLKAMIANVPATKKLVLIDTCNAGKLGEAIQMAMLTRGMSEDTALKILSRAVGSTILSASNSVQQALEGYKNHGLFTWVVAEGLKGAADGDKDGYVKTHELVNYVDGQVPELAEQVFKHKQYPTTTLSGQGFPVVKVK